MIRRIKNIVKKYISIILYSPKVFNPLVKVFYRTALTGKGSNLCLQRGFLPVPIHFYSPIPDISDLERRKVWDKKSELCGIDFQPDKQIRFLKRLARVYSKECRWPIEPTGNQGDFYLNNPSFSYGCAASTHCIIRHFKPNRIYEIGSGMSSLVISKALKLNLIENKTQSKYTIIDPYPGDIIRNSISDTVEIIQERVELMDAKHFEKLNRNDILFIDSGHSVRTGGDVNYLYLDVLPRLNPGVVIHIHDIALPYEYPRVYATNEAFRQFWTEQYLLQAFLCFNSKYDILLAMNYIMIDRLDVFKSSFPYYDPSSYPFISGSFWIRHK